MTTVPGSEIELGEPAGIDEGVVLGRRPERTVASERLVLGAGATLRSGTVIYAGSTIGARLETGHGVIVREEVVLGDRVRIWNHTTIDYGARIADDVRIHCNVYVCQGARIERGAFLAPGVTLANDPHPICMECLAGPTIGAEARIGAGAVILPGVRIGAGALVGAGAVVTADVADRAVVYGNPARAHGEVSRIICPSRGGPAYPGEANR